MNVKDMTNEEKLNAIYEMTLQNHDVLRTIRRQQYFAGIVRILYWLIVFGFIGGAYYFLGPVINAFTGNSSKAGNAILQLDQLKNQLPETKIVNQLIEGLQKSSVSDQ